MPTFVCAAENPFRVTVESLGPTAGEVAESAFDQAYRQGGELVQKRQDERLVAALSFLDQTPDNPKALAMGAFACLVLASRDHDAASAARIATANTFLRRIQEEKSDDRNTYWILPLLSRIAADASLAGHLENSSKSALKDLLFPVCDSWFTLEDTRTDEETIWHIHGSDNHDVMRKQIAYLTAQFLAREPAWADLHYSDGKSAAQHRDGWALFFRDYFRQRALRGLSVEMASPCYAGVLLYPIVNIRDASSDPQVRELAEKYLDVFFADAAQESLNGVRGGAKTRAYKYIHIIGFRDKTACYSWTLTGLPQAGVSMPFESYPGLATDYRLPRQVLELYHLPYARGTFESVTSRPGRGGHKTPPLIYHVDFPSHLQRTSFVTPDFVLGTFTSDESREYTMLITQNHWMGLIAGDALDSRIVLTAAVPPHSQKNHNDLQAVQRRGTALFRRHNRCAAKREIRAFVSDTFRVTEDDSGWVFAENSDGSVYVAMRASDPDDAGARHALEPAESAGVTGTWVRFLNRDAMIMMECASSSEVSGLEEFAAGLRGRSGTWVDDNTFRYSGRHSVLTLFRDSTIPLIDDKPVNMTPERTYDSPYLVHERGSDTVYIRGVSGTVRAVDVGSGE